MAGSSNLPLSTKKMIKKIKFKNFKGNLLAGVHYLPKKPKRISIVMSHGFLLHKNGPSKIYKKLSEQLYKKGYEVLRYDFSYCGESTGKISDLTKWNRLKDLKSAIKQLKNKDLILIGHSAGGITSIKEALKNKNVKKLITMGSPLNMKPMGSNVRKAFIKKHKIKILDQIKLRIDYELGVNQSFLKKLNKLKVPTLFIYSQKDIYCDYTKINEITNRKIKVLKVPNTDHFFKNKEKFIINNILKFIENGK